jgi:hypothetical protein
VRKPVIEHMVQGHMVQGAGMETSDLLYANLQSIAARGLGSFLQAIAQLAPDEDLHKAGDHWIQAFETTEWDPEMKPDKFVLQVTINALLGGWLRREK